MKYSLALIGAGQLGSRHLQGLALLHQELEIYIVDPDHNSIATAIERFKEVSGYDNKKLIACQNIGELPSILNFVILATNSDVRYQMFVDLIQHYSIDYFILEKVLFQELDQYDSALQLVREKNIKAWVNCPRRVWPLYKQIKAEIMASKICHVSALGSNWGLGSNAIHIIDLAAFLLNGTEYTVGNISFRAEPFPSKRKGYYDFFASVDIKFLSGTTLEMHSFPATDLPFIVNIYCENSIYSIREWEGKIVVMKKNEIDVNSEFPVVFQSNLTNEYIEEIISSGNCSLTPITDSIKLHQTYLISLMQSINDQFSLDWRLCKIT
ncbi:MAG: hypothetical protein K9I71_03400 [Ignavibacteriales bacterium]|nr:hypothetical protein [Melioribacteraceae bacterium]MCF8315140.1 hypothetical protein [Ignavibacteriales bacterium]MCF8435864.1 hypothetical protein [Ignavibacteriales bacterium]